MPMPTSRALKWMACGMLITTCMSAVAANGLHPDVPLLDETGQPVLVSGKPWSSMESCGGDCHDTGYIAGSSDHADAGASQLNQGSELQAWQRGHGYFGGWDPLRYDLDGLTNAAELDLQAWLRRFGARHVGGGPVAELVEMDCLLCHKPDWSYGRRRRIPACWFCRLR